MPTNTARIAKNTLMLYIRQMFSLFGNLYIVRIVLDALGVEDYGIYNVVAGATSMFSFFAGAMDSAANRFLSYELGRGDLKRYNEIFCLCINICIVIAIIVVILLETVGLWFVNNKLIIPGLRVNAANVVYQLMICSFVITTIKSVYMTSITSHERMGIYAGISIMEVVLKLFVSFLLSVFSGDRLILYATLLFVCTCIDLAIYAIICNYLFPECRFKLYWNYKKSKEIAVYFNWTILAFFSSFMRKQGITILLNMFFGPVVSAARGIAYQVDSAVSSFAQNFSQATRPQITKLYAQGIYDGVSSLVVFSIKIIFFLMLLVVVPFYIEAVFIMNLWLKQVPEYTVLFIRLIFFSIMFEIPIFPVSCLVYAIGNIRGYQLIAVGTALFVPLVSYLFLKIGFPPQTPMFVGVFASLVAFWGRLLVVKNVVQFPIIPLILRILPRIIGVSLLVVVIPLFVHIILPSGFLRFLGVGCSSVVSWCLCVYFLGLTNKEKKRIISLIKKRFFHCELKN
jgi:O-antigen/teichoic acid export membrane protein